MSETISFPPVSDSTPSAKRPPTVYFIDDSATMREVIKIAFRRENIAVITCGDAASAVAQFEQNPPDAVITDVIMPDQDGYSVCSQIKQHERFGATPVILMSGVVNKSVADKAVAVGADELIRKPFQPQELIARVKSFLGAKISEPAAPAAPAPRAASPLSSLFAPPPPAPAHVAPRPAPQGSPAFPPPPNLASPAPARLQASAGDIQKLKTEISRLELLIKKLQTELQIERQYNQALELHVRSLTSVE